jgi:hypothetical protein
MSKLAHSLVFDTETNELSIDGVVLPFEFIDLTPVFGARRSHPRAEPELVPAVTLTLLGASLEVLSRFSGDDT